MKQKNVLYTIQSWEDDWKKPKYRFKSDKLEFSKTSESLEGLARICAEETTFIINRFETLSQPQILGENLEIPVSTEEMKEFIQFYSHYSMSLE